MEVTCNIVTSYKLLFFGNGNEYTDTDVIFFDNEF